MKTFYQRYFLSFVNSITLFCGGIIVFMVGGVSQAAISSLQKNDYSIEIQKLFQSALSHQSMEALQKEQTQSFEFSHAQVQSLNLPKVQLKASTGKKENFDGEDNVYLNLTHNIFRGGIDQKKLQISENQNFSLQLNQLKEQRQILKDIIDAYYAHWQNFWDFKNSQLSYELTEKRLKEISGRAQIGKSRSLEVLQAKAQLGLVEAQRKNAELNLEESKLKLKLMTGINDLNNDQLFPMAQNENQLANSLSRNNHSALLKNFTSLDLSQLNSSSQTEGETDLSAQQMSAEISKDNHVEIKEKILKIDTLKKEYSVKR